MQEGGIPVDPAPGSYVFFKKIKAIMAYFRSSDSFLKFIDMKAFFLPLAFWFSILFPGFIFSQSPDSSLFNAMQWRMIGPFRGGRTVGAVGVPQQPSVFYIGVNNGGVWKTNDYGRTWVPIFDQEQTGSIGDIVVAPSNPNVLYVGTGEGIQRPDLSVGNGIYKSTDAG